VDKVVEGQSQHIVIATPKTSDKLVTLQKEIHNALIKGGPLSLTGEARRGGPDYRLDERACSPQSAAKRDKDMAKG
jgi:hypothetical protein